MNDNIKLSDILANLNVVRDGDKVTAFTIDRRGWGRGDRGGLLLDTSYDPVNDYVSKLEDALNPRMCCLGFYGMACGLSADDVSNLSYFNELSISALDMAPETGWLFSEVDEGEAPSVDQADFEHVLAYFNDAKDTEDSQKEGDITAWFAKQGITVSFIN